MVYKQIGKYIFKWTGISLLLGFLGAGLVFLMKTSIERLSVINQQYLISPLIGGLLVGFIVYYWDSRAKGLGTNIYISYVKGERDLIKPGKLLTAKFAATLLTLGLIGVGGLVGPLLLLGSVLAVIIKEIFSSFKVNLVFDGGDQKVLSVCGAAATLGPWLGTPLAGGIFASEVLYISSLDYNDLFPALLSSSIGYFFYQFVVPEQSSELAVKFPEFNLQQVGLLFIAALLCGLIGQLFILIFNAGFDFFAEMDFPPLFKPVFAGGVVLILSNLIKPVNINQLSDLFSYLFSPQVLLGVLVFKILSVIIVVSSGGSAAVVDVAFFSGALAGNLLYYLFPQLPLSALIVVGLSATLASIANVPLAAIVLVTEMVDLNSSLPVVIGGIIGFLIGRPGTVFKYINR